MQRFLIMFATLALVGCVTVGDLENVTKPPPNKPLVFGNVKVLAENAPEDWGNTFFSGHSFSLLILAKGKSEAKRYQLDTDNGFYWALAPGEYFLLGYMWRHFNQRINQRIWASFSVPADAKAVYVGDITIAIEQWCW